MTRNAISPLFAINATSAANSPLRLASVRIPRSARSRCLQNSWCERRLDLSPEALKQYYLHCSGGRRQLSCWARFACYRSSHQHLRQPQLRHNFYYHHRLLLLQPPTTHRWSRYHTPMAWALSKCSISPGCASGEGISLCVSCLWRWLASEASMIFCALIQFLLLQFLIVSCE